MTGGITRQGDIEYGKYRTGKLALNHVAENSPPNSDIQVRQLRSFTQFASLDESKLYARALQKEAWSITDDAAYLTIPIPPMKPLQEGSEPVMQARSLHAELFLQRNAEWLEKHFGVTGVQGMISHEDGGTIQLRVNAEQYHEKIAPLAKETRGASR